MFNFITIVIVLLVLGFIGWKRLDFALIILPLFFPAYLIRAKILFITTTLLELSIYLLFFIWIIRGPRRRNIFGPFNFPLIFLILAVIIATLISSHLKVSLGIAKAWFFDPLLYFFLVLQVIKTIKQVGRFFFALIISGVVVSVIGIAQASLGMVTSDGRIASLYEGVPNYLALYLAPILILSLVLFFKLSCEKAFIKCGLFLSIIILFYALFLSRSYGGFFAVIISLIIFFFFLPRKSQWMLLGAFLLVVTFFLFFQISSSKWQQFVNWRESSSTQARLQIWRTSLAILQDHWFWGVGLGQFEPIYQKYLPRYFFPPLEWVVRDPHNLFLSFWLNLGAIGFLSFLAILFIFFWQAIISLKKSKTSSLTKTFLFASVFGMITILIHGLIDVPYWKNDLSFVFWLLISLALVLKNIVFYQRKNEYAGV